MVKLKLWEQYDTYEIFSKFKELHEYAMKCLEEVKENGEILRQQDEQREGAWSMVMELLGKDIWKIYNPYLE